MIKRNILNFSGLLFSAAMFPGLALSAPPPPGSGGNGGPGAHGGPQFPVSVTGAREKAAQRFAELDADGDGEISRAELEQAPRRGSGDSARTQRETRRERMFERLDSNESGGIDRDELTRGPRHLEAMDSDGDGMVTREEARAYRESHRRPDR